MPRGEPLHDNDWKEDARKRREEEARRQRDRERAVGEQRANAEQFADYIEGTTHHSGDREREVQWYLSNSHRRIREIFRLVDQEREDDFIDLIRGTHHHSGDDHLERQWYRRHALSRQLDRIWTVITESVAAKVGILADNFEFVIRETPHHCGDRGREIAWFVGNVNASNFAKIGRVLPARFRVPNPISVLQADSTGCQPHERYVSPIPKFIEDNIPFVPIIGHCEVRPDKAPELKAYLERLKRYENGEREPGEPPSAAIPNQP